MSWTPRSKVKLEEIPQIPDSPLRAPAVVPMNGSGPSSPVPVTLAEPEQLALVPIAAPVRIHAPIESKVDLMKFGDHDLGNAERLVAMHGANIRYCHAQKKWLIWDGTRWRVDEVEEIRRLGKLTIVEFTRQAIAKGTFSARDNEAADQAWSVLCRVETSRAPGDYLA